MNIPVPRTYESKPMMHTGENNIVIEPSSSPKNAALKQSTFGLNVRGREQDDNPGGAANNSSGKKPPILAHLRSAEDHKFLRGISSSSPKQMESAAAYDEQDDRQEGPTFRPGQMIDLWKNLQDLLRN